MSRDLTVIGGGGHAKVVIATARLCGWHVAAVFDDDLAKAGGDILGAPIRGATDEATRVGCPAVIAVGSNRQREELAARLALEWVVLIHPSATVHESVEVGAGTVIFAGAVVQPEARIDEHAIVNTGATVDHDCRIEAFAHIGPGVHLAGDVTVSRGALVGIGACAVPGVKIGERATVGAGATVVVDIPAGATAVGTPARPLEAL